MESSQIPLVGGTHHGQIIQVDANIEEIELDVHASDSTGDPLFVETYERRHFEGDGFGEGMNCFALKSDDATEQMELARWSYPSFLELRKSISRLIIEDDGKGFEATDAAVMIGSDRGMGLPGMRERAKRFGGKSEIESTLGKGTTVYVRVPVIFDGQIRLDATT